MTHTQEQIWGFIISRENVEENLGFEITDEQYKEIADTLEYCALEKLYEREVKSAAEHWLITNKQRKH